MHNTYKSFRIIITLLLFVSSVSAFAEKRCGWLLNPTPANWWLIDKDGTWTLSEQGRISMSDKSWDNMPEMKNNERVLTNGPYGYGCACLQVKSSKGNMRILEVYSGKQLPLKICQRDRKLKKP